MPGSVKEYIISRLGTGMNLPSPIHPYVNFGKEMGVQLPSYSAYQESEPYGFAISGSKRSRLGTLVWSDLELSYNDVEVYIDTALFNVSQSKNIVTTALQGRNGTIKEYISDGDYVIDIRGAIVSPDREYPEDEVRNLVNLLQQPYVLGAISPLLQLFEVYSLVVVNYQLLSTNGFTNTQFFEINAISDSPIELISDDTTNL